MLVSTAGGYNAVRRNDGEIAKAVLDGHIGWIHWRGGLEGRLRTAACAAATADHAWRANGVRNRTSGWSGDFADDGDGGGETGADHDVGQGRNRGRVELAAEYGRSLRAKNGSAEN